MAWTMKVDSGGCEAMNIWKCLKGIEDRTRVNFKRRIIFSLLLLSCQQATLVQADCTNESLHQVIQAKDALALRETLRQYNVRKGRSAEHCSELTAALAEATWTECAVCAGLLLDAGARYDLRENYRTGYSSSWAHLIGTASPETLRAYLDHGLDLRYVDIKDQSTFLHTAADFGNADSVRWLIAHGNRVDARDKDSRTPLMLAAEKGHVEVVKALLAAKADVALRDNSSRTAKWLAANAGNGEKVEHPEWYKEIMRLLEVNGAREYVGKRLPFSYASWRASLEPQRDATDGFYKALPFVRPNIRFFAVDDMAFGRVLDSVLGDRPRKLNVFAVLPGKNFEVMRVSDTSVFPRLGLQVHTAADALKLVQFISDPGRSYSWSGYSFQDIDFRALPHGDDCIEVSPEPLMKAGVSDPVARGPLVSSGTPYFEVIRYVIPASFRVSSIRNSVRTRLSGDANYSLSSVVKVVERVTTDGRYSVTRETVPTPGLTISPLCHIL